MRPEAVIDVPEAKGKRIQLLPLIKELKILTKDLRIVRIGDVINYAQIDFIERCERQLYERGQIRIIVLKARQIGISTIIEAISFVMSMMFDNFGSKIVSHEDKSAMAILEMTRRYWDTYVFAKYHQERYVSRKHLAWNNGSDIDIATAKNAQAGRSMTINLLHASEVAFWDKAELLMTGLAQSIPTFGLNAIFLESTANGVGNFFHKQCNLAMKGESEYEFVFYPWYKHPEYTAAYLPNEEVAKNQLGELDEEERRLRDVYGIDDARLIWRRWCIKNRCQGDVDKFHQEYPTTPHEAFISTGSNVYPLNDLLAHYVPMHGERGRFINIRGRIKFVPDPKGYVRIFAHPSADTDWGVYLVGADPTHSTAGDYACAQVINRRTLEQVAVYRRKIDPVNFGRDLRTLATYYNEALIAPERTGPGYATIGVLTNPDNPYPNVYAMRNVARMQGIHLGGIAGWATNFESKELAVQTLKARVLEPLVHLGDQPYGLVIHDEATLVEMRDYVAREDGKGYSNSDGSDYDDGVMALAIAVTVHSIEPPPPAYEVHEHLPPPALTVAAEGVKSGVARPFVDNLPTDRHVRKPEDAELAESSAPWESWDTFENDPLAER